jgi:hypothetical protein
MENGKWKMEKVADACAKALARRDFQRCLPFFDSED